MGSEETTTEWSWRLLRTGTRGRYEMVERRLVVEYVVKKFPDRIWAKMWKRLGPTPRILEKMYPTVPKSVLRVYLPYCDAVVVTKDRIYIIEVKVHNIHSGISQLQQYVMIAPHDPEIQRFLPRPIVGRFVTWRYDPTIEALCRANGFEYDIYFPEWLKPHLRRYGYVV